MYVLSYTGRQPENTTINSIESTVYQVVYLYLKLSSFTNVQTPPIKRKTSQIKNLSEPREGEAGTLDFAHDGGVTQLLSPVTYPQTHIIRFFPRLCWGSEAKMPIHIASGARRLERRFLASGGGAMARGSTFEEL